MPQSSLLRGCLIKTVRWPRTQRLQWLGSAPLTPLVSVIIHARDTTDIWPTSISQNCGVTLPCCRCCAIGTARKCEKRAKRYYKWGFVNAPLFLSHFSQLRSTNNFCQCTSVNQTATTNIRTAAEERSVPAIIFILLLLTALVWANSPSPSLFHFIAVPLCCSVSARFGFCTLNKVIEWNYFWQLICIHQQQPKAEAGTFGVGVPVGVWSWRPC